MSASNEILASLDDINAFLPDMAMVDTVDDRQLQVDANRVVKSQLAGVFTAVTLTQWDSPADTPELIRGIAGRLVAAKYYAKQFSQESTDVPKYAQGLYNEAIGMLSSIRSGQLIVLDENNEPIESGSDLNLGSGDVYPNDAAPDPVFSMGAEFG